MPTKVLLSCFDFPPNEGIGGRRWAKFAKALAKNGHQVFVLKAKPKNNRTNSQWTKDVASDSIQILELDRAYPLILSNPGSSLKDRVKYKTTRGKFLRKYKGTIYDDSLGMEDLYLRELKKLIVDENIQNIIVTGAPFNLLHYTAKLKREFPQLNLIGDYRDPWIDATNYGMQDLTPKRRDYEIGKQQFVFDNFNYITFPSESLKPELLQFANNPKEIESKFKTLTHFYDIDDFDARIISPQGPKKIKIVYGGTVYQGTESFLQKVKEALDSIKENEKEIYRKMELQFYTQQTNALKMFEDHPVVTVNKTIGNKLNEKLKLSDGIFIFLGEHNKDFQTTKFMECLPLFKPLVYVGPEGETSKLIEENSLGFVIRKSEDFVEMIHKLCDPNYEFKSSFEITRYSLSKITKQLEELFV